MNGAWVEYGQSCFCFEMGVSLSSPEWPGTLDPILSAASAGIYYHTSLSELY